VLVNVAGERQLTLAERRARRARIARIGSESGERSLDSRLEIIGRGSTNPTLSRDVYLKRRCVTPTV